MYAKDVCHAGERYAKLIIEKRDYQYEENRVSAGRQRRPYYVCRCDCGTYKVICGYDLLKGTTTSCGCAKTEHKTKRRKDDIIGMQFGNLTVLCRDSSAQYGSGLHTKWICKCSLCGSMKSIRGSNLRLGKAVDCGCTSKKLHSGRECDLSGSTFGYLEVLEKDSSTGKKSGQHTKWICVCGICGCSESISSDLLKGGAKIMCHNCCKKSIGEKKISELLKEHCISFKRDKPYSTCINDRTGHPLRFDFIIEYEPLPYIIEYDGLQHFRSAPMWDANGDLEERQRRDRLKDKWCADNHIYLIRIPYTHLRDIGIDDLCPTTSTFLVTTNQQTNISNL